MRRLIESGAVKGKNFVQVGLRGYWPPVETFEWMKEQGLRYHFMREIEERGAEAVIAQAIDEALDGPDYVYLSLDIDVIDPGMAPGTGHPGAGRDADPRGPPGDPPDRRRPWTWPGWTSSRCRRRTTRPRPRRWPPTAPRSRRSARSRSGASPASPSAGRACRSRPTVPAEPDRAPRPPGLTAPMLDEPDAATAAALARLYDLDLVDDPGDLDLYLALADRADGPVLELAVGTGRLAIPLAEAGHRGHRRSTSTRRCSTGRAPSARGGTPARTGSSSSRPTCVELRLPDAGRFGLAFVALNSLLLLRDPRAPSGPRSGRWPTTSRPVAWRSSTSGCPTPTTWPGSTAGSSSSGRASTRRRARIVTKTGSAQHDAATGTVTLTTIFEEGGQGEPTRALGPARPAAARVGRRTARVRRGGRARRRARWRAATTSARSGPGSERAILIAVKP